MEYKVGQQLRSHDFPGESLKEHYIEGDIIEVVDQYWIRLKCTYDNSANEKFNRVGDTFRIPVNVAGDEVWGYPRLEILKSE